MDVEFHHIPNVTTIRAKVKLKSKAIMFYKFSRPSSEKVAMINYQSIFRTKIWHVLWNVHPI